MAIAFVPLTHSLSRHWSMLILATVRRALDGSVGAMACREHW